MGKKKVLFVATVVKTHIMQFHIPYLKMLQQMGWETAVAARNDYDDPQDCHIPYCDAYYDIPFERTPWKPGNLKAFAMLKKVIDQGEYDLIHCHTPVGALLTRLAAVEARRRGTTVMYTAHGFHFFKGAPLRNWLLFYPAEWLLAPLTDILLTINREDYQRALKHMHAKRIVYVPGVGISTEKFQKVPEDSGETRKKLGYGQEDFLILTVAEMTSNKNHITILKALALLKDDPMFRNTHYLICGRGDMLEKLEDSVEQLGLDGHVNFLGYRRDVQQLYHCCDLFAFMPYREGLSVALMEAMCSQMPIVCTRIRGNTDLIDDGVSGVFSDNRPDALAEHIRRLYQNPELRASLGQEAAKKVMQFDEKAVQKQMREIYESIV